MDLGNGENMAKLNHPVPAFQLKKNLFAVPTWLTVIVIKMNYIQRLQG